MLDQPTATDASRGRLAAETVPRWPSASLAAAGLLGAAGVGVGAAGAHSGGGDLARLSSEFLLIHAAAIAAGSGIAMTAPRGAGLLAAALALLAVGAALFGGELAVAALLDWRPLPVAAPAGGLCLVAGWLCLAGVGVVLGLARRRGQRKA